MLATELILFLVLVAAGALVQSITGFAMGLIIMGGVAALGVVDIPFAAAVVSLVSMVNASIALRHTYRFVDIRLWRLLSYGLVPATLVGVVLLEILSAGFYEGLKMLLGIVIIGAGTLLMLQPRPWPQVSGNSTVVGIGAAGGIIAGLYSAGGAPIAWLMYRQPLPVNVVRATLLATFLVSTIGRTLIVVAYGGMTQSILWSALLSVPVVVVVTVVSTRLAHFVPDRLVRRFVFGLLIVLGLSLILQQ